MSITPSLASARRAQRRQQRHLVNAGRALGGPEVDEQRATAEIGQRAGGAGEVRQCEVGSEIADGDGCGRVV